MTNANAIHLYWWTRKDGIKNLGDEITKIIFNRMYSLECNQTPLGRASVIGTGSILGWIFDRTDLTDRDYKLTVLGSGLMDPWIQTSARDYLDFYAIRGYLTESVLSKMLPNKVTIGDPGLLFSSITQTRPIEKKFQYGIIPHLGRLDVKSFYDRFSCLEHIKFIDFRTDDVDDIACQMRECKIIISQGLHGLIFADSLFIPNVWLRAEKLHQTNFKFYDYFSSIERPFDRFVHLDRLSHREIEDNIFIANRSVVERRKNGLIKAFERYVRAEGFAPEHKMI